MRVCARCRANPVAKYAKLCEGCRKICSVCGKNENKPGQRMCLGCHALRMRETRPRYCELTPEQRQAASARSLARHYLKKGLIEREVCVEAGCDLPAQMHQPDPARPVLIVWACKKHWRRLKLQE
jgi:hypothetical protein